MQILQVVIHELIKEPARNGSPAIQAHFSEANELLDITHPATIKLVENIQKLYGTRGNYSSQGTFDLDNRSYTFPTDFREFADSSGDEDCFSVLSIKSMEALVEKSSQQNFATGGYIVFSHYEQNGQNFLLVAMVKKKDGITLIDLKPENIDQVDLSKLHQAIKINIGKYAQAMEHLERDTPFEGSYLSFISSASEKGASGYFIQAFGCKDAIPSEQATESTFDAIKYFLDSYDQLKPLQNQAQDAVISLFSDKLSNEQSEDRICTLEEINSTIQTIIDANDIQDVTNNFMDIANSEDFSVPNSFYPNKKCISKLTRLKLKAPGGIWDFNFEKRLFGDSTEDQIQYVRSDANNESSIVIRNLPEKVIELLEKELGNEPSH